MNTQTAERVRPADLRQSSEGGQLAVVTPDFQAPRPSVSEAFPSASGFANIAKAVAAVMSEIQPVEKAGWNDFQKYKYAGMGDILKTLTPLLGKHGLMIVPTEQSRSLFGSDTAMHIIYEFTIAHSSGEVWPERPTWTGMARARDSKGGYDDKAANKCATAAQKSFFKAFFCIPTTDEEEDGDSGRVPARDRTPPSPKANGRPAPHLIRIVNGEAPEAWVARYVAAISKAESTAELDKWDTLNDEPLQKLNAVAGKLYAEVVEATRAREQQLAASPATPAQRRQPEENADGDREEWGESSQGSSDTTPATPSAPRTPPSPSKKFEEPELPASLDRRGETANNINLWLKELDNAFSGCEDFSSLTEVQHQRMAPKKGTVPSSAWHRAEGLLKAHTDRVTKEQGDEQS